MRTEYEINQIVARIQAQINKNISERNSNSNSNSKGKGKDNSQKVFIYNLQDFKDKGK